MPRDSDIRIALLGAGTVCQSSHIPALCESGIQIVSITDPNRQSLEAAASLVGYPVEVFASDEIQISRQANAAVVCTPPVLHYRQVDALLDQAIHTLCEKPLATNGKHAEELAHKARGAGCVLQVGFLRRFHESAQFVRALLASGELGSLQRCTARCGWNARDLPDSFFNPRLSGGGVLMDYGVHVVDRMLDWFGAISLDSYADDWEGGMEANALIKATALVEGTDVPLEIKLSRTHDLGLQIRVEFQRATIVLDNEIGCRVWIEAKEPFEYAEAAWPFRAELTVGATKERIDYFRDQLKEFVAASQGANPVCSDLNDAVRVSKFVDECYGARRRLVSHFGV
jgi:predicted dehydrogenase